MAIFSETFSPVMHDRVEVIRDLQSVDVAATVFIEVVLFA